MKILFLDFFRYFFPLLISSPKLTSLPLSEHLAPFLSPFHALLFHWFCSDTGGHSININQPWYIKQHQNRESPPLARLGETIIRVHFIDFFFHSCLVLSSVSGVSGFWVLVLGGERPLRVWVNSYTSHQLVTPTISLPSFHQHISQTGQIVGQRVCEWVISPRSLMEVLSGYRR